MKTYLVWCLNHGSTRTDASRVEARNAEAAACEWAEQEDAWSADYWIVGGETARVVVAEDKEGSIELRFDVRGEALPTYTASASSA